MLPCFDPTHWPDFSTGFRLGNSWIQVLHRNCSCICELDVRFLNHPNWTSTTQVMVHFLRLPQLRVSSVCVRISRLVFSADFILILGLKFWTEV